MAILSAGAATLPPVATAQLSLPRLFADGMMLQRDFPVHIWGKAAPGAAVSVSLDDAAYEATADVQGRWDLLLPALPAGGPHSMSVRSGTQTIGIQDILAGDIWVASGQSNMEWPVENVINAEQEVASANDPMIRHFFVPHSWAETPEETLAGGEWERADPAHVGSFTAIGYFFARTLRKEIGVPIGLIHTSWGGSRIEPWMSAEALGLDSAGMDAIMEREREKSERIIEALTARVGPLPEKDPGLVGGQAVWADPSLDEDGWDTVPVPSSWEQAGYAGMDGIGWYRTAFNLTAEEARQPVEVGLGAIDDSDISWVNGVEVGQTENQWNLNRVYTVPASALREGRNVIAVRVEDTGGGGGIAGAAEALYVQTAGRRLSLAGPWRFRVGEVTFNSSGEKNQVATLLFNKMIYPLLPFPIKGVIWYQGESNAGGDDAVAYRNQFATMIESWRNQWNVGAFPFLWVQLANYMQPQSEPSESDWAVLRESQTRALALPNTGQALAIDLGVAEDIHPRNKQDVGKRLAFAALHVAYGKTLVYSGPVYDSHSAADGRVRLRFNHTGSGLVAKDGPLKGFAVAGPDRKFQWANARIDGDEVVVWNDAVPYPVAVRYAWADNPDKANLYNAEGLPADPFRTDAW